MAAGVLFAVVVTALAHGAVEPWSVMLFELITLTLMGLWAGRMLAEKRLRISLPPAALPMMALIAVGLLQSVAFTGGDGNRASLSLDVEATRRAVVVLIFLFLAFVIAYNVFAGRDRLSRLSTFLVTYGLAMAVFALIQHFTWNGKFYWLRPNRIQTTPFGPFVNHNHFAGYMELLMCVPIAMVMARAVRRESHLLYGFAATMMGIAIMFSLSRGGMISMVAALLFLIVAGRRLATKASAGKGGRIRAAGGSRLSRLLAPVSRLGIVPVVAGVILLGVFWLGPEAVIERVTVGQQTPGDTTLLSNRDWVWRDTLTMIADNPLLGVGLGAYGTAFSIYTQTNGTLRVPQAHNDYLQVVADGGLAGGLIAIWLLVAIFRSIWRGIGHSDPLMAGLALGCGGGIVALLVHSLIDFNLQLPSNALLFLLLTAVVSRVAAAAEQSIPAVVRPSRVVIESGVEVISAARRMP